ncbi:flavodoxin family protein [Calderihabitans maritimus]|uniref:NADPH-dependent FMN reductase n=1 Tax=Calderihabitans maritimus TaxID=1246530 RepID=A0A1Z5HWY2_9FIRM|nr:flavodoxin family protein [Calderihabitans maritimus]GAW93867.1 NADPH-dependent FMN reductase [Calderihabitans maritimus]
MLIVALNGSPKKDGNTAFLLKEALKVAESKGAETKLIHVVDVLADQKVPFCNNCSEPCRGVCSQGKKLGEAYDVLRRADGLLLGSPVYFGTVSAQLKAFWDKSRILRKEKALLNVVGGAVTTAAGRFGGQETTLKALYDMMLVHGMTVIGDGYREDDCGHHGACAQKPSAQDENAIKRVRVLAKRLVEVAEATRSLRLR